MLWLALILPQLPLQLHLRGAATPGLLAVTENRPHAQVIAATPAALEGGIRIGQRSSSALSILPGLTLRPRSPAAEMALLREVADWAGGFASRISIDPPDTILIEASASLRLFGGLHALTRRLQEGLAQQGLHAVSASAPTPLAARWFARAGIKLASATDDATHWHRHLDTLPLELLADGTQIPPAILDLLDGLGLGTLGEVRRLPRPGLARRQAQAVSAILARAYGEAPDLRNEYTSPEHYQARLELIDPSSHTEALMFASRRLFAGLASWLDARHAGVDHCRLTLEHERVPATVLDILTGTPARDEARFNLIAREHLTVLELPAPVTGLRLEARAPHRLQPRSSDLFDTTAATHENAALLLSRLQARLGDAHIQRLTPFPDQRPEQAWRSLPCQAHSTASRPTLHPAPHAPRPLWLLPAPQPLAKRTQLQLLRGPERIEHGWWDGHDVRRDYYLAHTDDHALWWVYRELDPPCAWYVHGYFA